MRPARMLLGTALALALAWPARGDPAPFPATVQTDGAEVRSKPGTEPAVYITQKLPRGTVVEVVERLPNGWLKIDPPLPGSYSWVNTRFLRRAAGAQGIWIVSAAGGQVPALVGSPYKSGKPDVVGATLARGAQVAAVGDVWRWEDGDWLPILPPPGEYRYVLEKDVAAPSGGSSTPPPTTAARPGSPGATPAAGGAGLPALAPAAPESSRPQSLEVHVGGPQSQSDVDPLFQQAQQAERSGDRAAAARLYDELGKKYFTSNHDAAIQYYSRAAWLRGGTTPAAPPPVTEADAVYQQAQQAERAGNWAEAIRGYTRLGDLCRDGDYKLSQMYYTRAGWLKQRHPAPAAAPPPVTGAAPPPAAVVQARAISLQEVGPGRIEPSPTPIDSGPTYVLESAQAVVIAYLTPQAGVDLERYVGQSVRVLGESVQRSDLRVPYVKVARVVPLSNP